MSEILDAALEIHDWLDAKGVPHFFIGGFAVQFWGRPRATADVDLCVVIPPDDVDRIVELLLADFKSRVPDALNFAAQNRVLLVFASNGCGVDVSLSGFWFDNEALTRNVVLEAAPGKHLPICSAEDLIVMKSIAGRAKDEEDLKFIIQLEHERLDVKLVRELLRQHTLLSDEDEAAQRFERFWRHYGPHNEDTPDV